MTDKRKKKVSRLKDDASLKRRLITLSRIFRAGMRDLFRSAWLSIAAIAVMVVALAVILFTVIINITMHNAISELSQNLRVSIYFHDDATEEERNSLRRALEASPATAKVDFVTKEQARERFVESFSDDEDILEGLLLVGADTLPASFEVTTTDLERIGEIETIAQREEFDDIIESITLGRTDARNAINRAAALQRFLVAASVLAGVIFTVISVLIIFNTIRIAIFTRREEISSMKLIGATPGYIRGPFLVAAAFYGVIAAILATGSIYALIYSAGPNLTANTELGLDQTYGFLTEPMTIAILFLATAGVGILVGMFSSDLAMRKHLKLKYW